jgi:hypothetical protein
LFAIVNGNDFGGFSGESLGMYLFTSIMILAPSLLGRYPSLSLSNSVEYTIALFFPEVVEGVAKMTTP